jgi:hypothetical protein
MDSKCKFAHSYEEMRVKQCKYDQHCTNANCIFKHSFEDAGEHAKRIGFQTIKSNSKNTLYNPPLHCKVFKMKLDADKETMSEIIGNQGVHFKNITELANVEYVWYKNKEKEIEVWSNTHVNVTMAFSMIKNHVYNVIFNKELKQNLGENIYNQIELLTHLKIWEIQKITGMILELDVNEIIYIINNKNELMSKVEEGLNLLK